MALGAWYSGVHSFQRVVGIGVLGYTESCRLEALDGVARRAFAAISSRVELALMRIILVAIEAALESNRLGEISPQVARITFDLCVLSEQWVLRSRVVELGARSGGGDLLPTGNRVARIACRLERPFMRILVAIVAGVERQALVLDDVRMVHFGLVAFLAGDAHVLAKQRVASLGVFELGYGLPFAERVTAQAVGA